MTPQIFNDLDELQELSNLVVRIALNAERNRSNNNLVQTAYLIVFAPHCALRIGALLSSLHLSAPPLPTAGVDPLIALTTYAGNLKKLQEILTHLQQVEH